MNRGALILRFLPVGVLAAIALACNPLAPRLDRARMAAQEASAIADIKRIGTAEVMYYSQFGMYAKSLAELGPPASGAPGPSASDDIPAALAVGKKNGYIFAVIARPNGFAVTAVPESFGATGTRTFYADESLVIHAHRGPQTPTSQDPELK